MTKAPKYLTEYHYYLTQANDLSNSLFPPFPDINLSMHTAPFSLSDVLSYGKLFPSCQNIVLHFTYTEPKSFLEAMKSGKWTKIMDVELIAFEDTDNWDVVSLHAEKHVTGNKWIYKIKYNSDGSVYRFKASLIAKRYTQ